VQFLQGVWRGKVVHERKLVIRPINLGCACNRNPLLSTTLKISPPKARLVRSTTTYSCPSEEKPRCFEISATTGLLVESILESRDFLCSGRHVETEIKIFPLATCYQATSRSAPKITWTYALYKARPSMSNYASRCSHQKPHIQNPVESILALQDLAPHLFAPTEAPTEASI
jgi:hypothetical protein